MRTVGAVVCGYLAMAITVFAGPVRTEVLGPFEAMMQARTPVWMMLVNPVIGVLGVLLGGRALGGQARGVTAAAA